MKLGIISLFFLFIFSLLPSQYCAQVYNITPSQPLAEGQTLVSPGQVFELGFFSPNNSANKYVGLWHKNIFPRKVVWVANRENPLAVTDQLASLRFGKNGNLELVDGKQTSVWSIIISVTNNSTAAVLLDSGTFVLKDDTGADLWQSLDYPSDSLLPGMKLGFDSNSGKWNFMTSWKSENDPSTGIFLVGLSAQIPTQVFIWKNGSTPCWRSGPWDKSKFIGIPQMNTQQYLTGITLDENVEQGTRYFSYSSLGDNTVSYRFISSQGILTYIISESGMKNWSINWQAPNNTCDSYGACGPFGVCKAAESPICKCLKGFIPKSDKEWSKRNWTGGCVRRTNLFCERHINRSVSSIGKEHGFFKMKGIKVPDFHEYLESLALDQFEDCKIQCLTNCSCVAYTFVNIIGCLVWFKDLIDIQQFPSGGVDLYIRLAHSELGGEGKAIKLISSLTAVGIMSILVAIIFGLHRLRANQKGNIDLTTQRLELTGLLREYIGDHDPLELKVYDFNSILIATDNFSFTNKLGQGGFGPVYKGMLPDGKEIAVKRLSSSSGQGVEEFKNEMRLIFNLQHKNLVRIMGCCVKEDEKLLIYEFMPNRSLDTFLYDPTKRAVLDWTTRFSIIQGVAKGLLYLHHDSYVKVIHRDLKVSNILLDDKMNPKISDFGLARIVEGTQLPENTQKVVGTRGYMSPEYAMCGIFSEKSDIYSFGVLVLEIISSKKNTSFCLYDQQQGFLSYAWNLWNEGKGLALVDEVLGDSYSPSEVMRCVQIGLLCVQDNAVDRPTMPDVVLMLNSEPDGPQPKQPIFTIQNSVHHPQPHYGNTNSSKSESTITLIEGR
ncbi:hypothetical protein M0R45_005994 [Rubus argutus]|uniref:Receptor-like serine/threonine-protein kinase n=1 Tax=Rubus argutus TaxID=59490 RepID=A0AAW1YP88_RUBAR